VSPPPRLPEGEPGEVAPSAHPLAGLSAAARPRLVRALARAIREERDAAQQLDRLRGLGPR
jgi:hypothetical protein